VLALLTAGLLIAALLVPLVASSATAASPSACRVKNVKTGKVTKSLQAAVKKARRGHRLTVRGICHGSTYVGKSLSIAGVRTKGSGRPTLDADAKDTVLKVKLGVRVTITDLRIRDGKAARGGVFTDGVLTMWGSSSIRGNQASLGGGGVDTDGVLRLRGSSSIRDNETDGEGGGVRNGDDLVLHDTSSISGNEAEHGGGVWSDGAITMKDSSSIHHNTASTGGGGIWNDGGSVVDATCGSGGNVHDNSPNDCVLT
jgi:hypothetical protein